jgi:hypothetical protein
MGEDLSCHFPGGIEIFTISEIHERHIDPVVIRLLGVIRCLGGLKGRGVQLPRPFGISCSALNQPSPLQTPGQDPHHIGAFPLLLFQQPYCILLTTDVF